MTRDDDAIRPEPCFVQLNPERPYFVQRKPEKLIRRGPCDYRIVGKNPDGTRAETRLSAVTFRIEGI